MAPSCLPLRRSSGLVDGPDRALVLLALGPEESRAASTRAALQRASPAVSSSAAAAFPNGWAPSWILL